jgi:hypothetical protein
MKTIDFDSNSKWRHSDKKQQVFFRFLKEIKNAATSWASLQRRGIGGSPDMSALPILNVGAAMLNKQALTNDFTRSLVVDITPP